MSSRLLLFPYLQFNYNLCFPDSVNSILNLQEQNELQSAGFCLKASFRFSSLPPAMTKPQLWADPYSHSVLYHVFWGAVVVWGF